MSFYPYGLQYAMLKMRELIVCGLKSYLFPSISQTWNLLKILHRRIFRLKILHCQFHLISTVLVRNNTKKWVKMEKFTQKLYTAAGSDGIANSTSAFLLGECSLNGTPCRRWLAAWSSCPESETTGALPPRRRGGRASGWPSKTTGECDWIPFHDKFNGRLAEESLELRNLSEEQGRACTLLAAELVEMVGHSTK